MICFRWVVNYLFALNCLMKILNRFARLILKPNGHWKKSTRSSYSLHGNFRLRMSLSNIFGRLLETLFRKCLPKILCMWMSAKALRPTGLNTICRCLSSKRQPCLIICRRQRFWWCQKHSMPPHRLFMPKPTSVFSNVNTILNDLY